MASLYILYPALSSFCIFAAGTSVMVNTSKGPILGKHVNFGNDKKQLYYGEADVFLGIPFVKPPVKELRFMKPQPLVKLTEDGSPYNATSYPPACPQYGDSYYLPQGFRRSEDCLYLNVFSPNSSDSKLPVMIWIHGGSFILGSTQRYDVEGIVRNFVARGVIIVTLQYRLGMLGFFTTGTDDFPPNLGMLDQVEAIKWVSEEIANFGGDPKHITLFGHSAGACSASAHLLSPLSNGYFQQAIVQSASIYTCLDGALNHSYNNEQRAKQICNITLPAIGEDMKRLKNCLMNADYNDFTKLDSELLFGWQFKVDGYFLPDVPERLAPRRSDVPVIYGNAKDEWSEFDLDALAAKIATLESFSRETFEDLFQSFTTMYGSHISELMSVVESVYVPSNVAADDHIGWLKIRSDVFTGMAFTSLISKEILSLSNNGNPNVYVYQFNYVSPVDQFFEVQGWEPVPHSAEVPFLFMPKKFWQNGTVANENDLKIADMLGEMWTDFAKHNFDGNNSFENFWEPVQSGDVIRYLEVATQPKMMSDYRTVDRVLWNKVIPGLAEHWKNENSTTSDTPDSTVAMGSTTAARKILTSASDTTQGSNGSSCITAQVYHLIILFVLASLNLR